MGRIMKTSEPGAVSVTALRQVADARGPVLHFLRCDSPDFVSFGEFYFSEVLPGMTKGWKRHRVQTQNIVVPVGRIQLVTFDDRVLSPERDGLNVFELGRPDAYCRVRIPPGIWYGFSCISAVPALLANCADVPHDPLESESRPLNDGPVRFDWGQVSRD